MELLGHSAIAAMNIYTHLRLDLLRSAVDRMDGVLGGEDKQSWPDVVVTVIVKRPLA